MPFSPQDRSVWIAETAELSVRITAEALQDMEREVMHGFKALPKRGAEAGGALYGSVAEENGVRTVTVERVLPVTCEYQSGPSFRLSETDHSKLAADLKAQTQPPVGFFRSNTRTDLELTPDDRVLLQRHFPVNGVVLLLRPLDLGDCEARIYSLVAGEVSSEGHGPFSFGWKYRKALADPNLEAVTPHRVPAPTPVEIPTIPARRRSLPYIWFAALLGGACLVSYYVGRHGRLASPVPADPGPFRLSVTRVGPTARVTWDSSHPQLRNVPEAVLTITDGDQNSIQRLSGDELRSGATSYQPRSGDVSFELRMPSASGWVTQSTRLISATPVDQEQSEDLAAPAPQLPPMASTATPLQPPQASISSVVVQHPLPVPDKPAVVETPPEVLAAQGTSRPPVPEPPAQAPETVKPRDAEAQVSQVLRSWSASLRDGDIETHISHYGPTLKTYFEDKAVPKQDIAKQVRQMVAQHGAFRTHDVRILSLRPVAPDRVTAVIRKRWTTAGSEAGEVEEELEFARRSQRWEIVSERQTRLLWVRH